MPAQGSVTATQVAAQVDPAPQPIPAAFVQGSGWQVPPMQTSPAAQVVAQPPELPLDPVDEPLEPPPDPPVPADPFPPPPVPLGAPGSFEEVPAPPLPVPDCDAENPHPTIKAAQSTLASPNPWRVVAIDRTRRSLVMLPPGGISGRAGNCG